MPLMHSLGLPGTLRASFAFYNTFQEAEQLAQALEQLVQSQKSILAVAELEQTSYQNALKSVYSATNWTSRYQSLMQLGQAAPPLPHALKQDRFLLPGCESRVWLITELDANGLLNCRADADARILRALLTLLLDQVNGLTPEQMLATDLEETLSQLDIQRHLSPSRGNGLLAIIRGLQDFARQQDE